MRHFSVHGAFTVFVFLVFLFMFVSESSASLFRAFGPRLAKLGQLHIHACHWRMDKYQQCWAMKRPSIRKYSEYQRISDNVPQCLRQCPAMSKPQWWTRTDELHDLNLRRNNDNRVAFFVVLFIRSLFFDVFLTSRCLMIDVFWMSCLLFNVFWIFVWLGCAQKALPSPTISV